MSHFQRYCLFIAYDGSNYCGWQVQPNGISVQEKIETALFTIFREEIKIFGSGRTDSKVHALELRAHFDVNISKEASKLKSSLNGLLPPDIRILDIQKVEKEFHARFSCKRKVYQYHVHTQKVLDPFHRHYRLHFSKSLNLDNIRQGISYLIGTHDFTSFANEAYRGSAKNNPIKTLYRIDLIEKEFGLIFELEGDGFLYKMVRNLVGSLLDIGLNKIAPEEIKKILMAKDRRKASTALAPQGLFLIKGIY